MARFSNRTVTRRAPPEHWNAEHDVVVVGCGYAGAMTAIAACDAGADVAILEKMPDPGGISICSAGGLRVAEDAAAAFAYLQATNAGTTPDDVLRRLAEGMTQLPAALDRLAAGTGATVNRRPSPANYPLPGYGTFGFVYVDSLPGFDPAAAWPHVQGSPPGAHLFKLLLDNLERRALAPRTGVRARRLVQGATGRVLGIEVESANGTETIRARRAVVLACGGFESAPDMQAQYWEIKPVLSAAFAGNTGDGIRMAQAAGATLWHMWHFHGSYGFRHPDPSYPFAIRTKRVPDWRPGDEATSAVALPWILLDRSGRRFMNEYEPYLQDTGARPLTRFRPERQDYAAIPAWLIADDDGRRLFPFGRPTHNQRGVRYEWSADNSREIELGIIRRAADVAALARDTGLAVETVRQSIDAWNDNCAAGRDPWFARPFESMMPVVKPPYWYAEVWPVVSNTQGGPAHDAEQRVLDPFGAPIPGLYAAGECGSVFGHLYMSGGNLAECFIGGAIAGRNAAADGPTTRGSIDA